MVYVAYCPLIKELFSINVEIQMQSRPCMVVGKQIRTTRGIGRLARSS